jgi:hypothetical protein
MILDMQHRGPYTVIMPRQRFILNQVLNQRSEDAIKQFSAPEHISDSLVVIGRKKVLKIIFEIHPVGQQYYRRKRRTLKNMVVQSFEVGENIGSGTIIYCLRLVKDAASEKMQITLTDYHFTIVGDKSTQAFGGKNNGIKGAVPVYNRFIGKYGIFPDIDDLCYLDIRGRILSFVYEHR